MGRPGDSWGRRGRSRERPQRFWERHRRSGERPGRTPERCGRSTEQAFDRTKAEVSKEFKSGGTFAEAEASAKLLLWFPLLWDLVIPERNDM